MELRTFSLSFGDIGDFCWRGFWFDQKSVKNSSFGGLFIHDCNSNGMPCILYDLLAKESIMSSSVSL